MVPRHAEGGAFSTENVAAMETFELNTGDRMDIFSIPINTSSIWFKWIIWMWLWWSWTNAQRTNCTCFIFWNSSQDWQENFGVRFFAGANSRNFFASLSYIVKKTWAFHWPWPFLLHSCCIPAARCLGISKVSRFPSRGWTTTLPMAHDNREQTEFHVLTYPLIFHLYNPLHIFKTI